MEIGLNTTRINYFTTNMPFKDMMKICDWFSPQGSNFEHIPGLSATNASGFPTEIVPPGTSKAIARPIGGDITLSGNVSAVYPIGEYHVFHSGTSNVEDIPFSSIFDLRGNVGVGGLAIYDVSSVGPGHGKFITPDVCKNLAIECTDATDASNVTNLSIVYKDYVDNYESQPFTSAILDQFSSLTTTYGPVRFLNWSRINDHPISSIDDPRYPTSAMPFQGSQYGAAIEYNMMFCNTLQRPAWICVPHLATPEYVSGLAQRYARGLDDNLTLYVERSNEVWNSNFEQYDHARDSAFAEDTTSSIFAWIQNRPERKNADQPPSYYPPGTPTRPDLAINQNAVSSIGPWRVGTAAAMWHAASSVAVFNIFKDVFQQERGSTSSIKHVLAWQKGSDDIMEYMLLFSGIPDGRRDGYVHESVDYISIAPYVGNKWANENEGLGSLSALNTIFETRAAAQDPPIDASNYVPDETDYASGMSSLFEYFESKTSGADEGIRSGVRDILFRLGVYPETSGIPLIGYEGGQHLTGFTARQRGTAEPVQGPHLSGIREFASQCMIRAQTDSRMRTFYKDYLEMLEEEFFETFVHYSNAGSWDDTGEGGWWGISPYYGGPSAKRDGMVDYLNLQGGEITLATLSLSFDITSSFEATTTPIALVVNQVGYKISNNNQ